MKKHDHRHLILAVTDDRQLLGHLRTTLPDEQLQVADSAPGLRKQLADAPAAVLIQDTLLNGELSKVLEELHQQAVPPMVTLLADSEHLNAAIQYLHEGLVFRFQTTPCNMQQLDLALHACIEQYDMLEHQRAMQQEIDRQVKLRTDNLQKLYNYVSIINDRESIQEICELAVDLTAQILNSKRVSLLLPDQHNRLLEMVSARGVPEYVRADVRIPIGHGIAGKVFSRCDCIVMHDGDDFEGEQGRYDSDCFASIPLVSTSLARHGKPVGVLNVTDPIDVDEYDEEALANLKAIAEATAIAIENKKHMASSIDSRDSVIMALARLSEYRNPDAGAHLQRLQIYCKLLCRALQKKSEYSSGITDEFIEDMVHAAPLHDIGKAGISEEILFKEKDLTEEEKEILRSHTRIGGDTLRSLIEQGNTEGFLRMAVKIAYGHHERWDGSGYPQGLQGETIPLPARIFAVADVYDSLRTHGQTSKSKGLPHSKARSIILEGAGTLFDPEVVHAFLACEKRLSRTASELSEGIDGFDLEILESDFNLDDENAA